MGKPSKVKTTDKIYFKYYRGGYKGPTVPRNASTRTTTQKYKSLNTNIEDTILCCGYCGNLARFEQTLEIIPGHVIRTCKAGVCIGIAIRDGVLPGSYKD